MVFENPVDRSIDLDRTCAQTAFRRNPKIAVSGTDAIIWVVFNPLRRCGMIETYATSLGCVSRMRWGGVAGSGGFYMGEQRNPRVFISYSWDSDAHKLWVESLATELRKVGVDARLDVWRDEDQSIDDFMIVELERADIVLAVCTPEFKRKIIENADGTRSSASGFEIGTAAALRRFNSKPIVPVLAHGTYPQAAPTNLIGYRYYDFVGSDRTKEFAELKDRLLGHTKVVPELGERSSPEERPKLPDIFADHGIARNDHPAGLKRLALGAMVTSLLVGGGLAFFYWLDGDSFETTTAEPDAHTGVLEESPRIRAITSDGLAVLSAWDTGVPVPDDVLARIYPYDARARDAIRERPDDPGVHQRLFQIFIGNLDDATRSGDPAIVILAPRGIVIERLSEVRLLRGRLSENNSWDIRVKIETLSGDVLYKSDVEFAKGASEVTIEVDIDLPEGIYALSGTVNDGERSQLLRASQFVRVVPAKTLADVVAKVKRTGNADLDGLLRAYALFSEEYYESGLAELERISANAPAVVAERRKALIDVLRAQPPRST